MRGLHWPGDGDTVLLVHDLGADLDCWADLPCALQTDGYRVVAIDLPGHGLSDDWTTAPNTADFLSALTTDLVARWPGRIFAVGVGGIVPLLDRTGAAAIVALGPQPALEDGAVGSHAPTLILVGGSDPEAAAAANRYFRNRRGWAVSSSFGNAQNGAGLLSGPWSGHVIEQIVAFLRDYRTQVKEP